MIFCSEYVPRKWQFVYRKHSPSATHKIALVISLRESVLPLLFQLFHEKDWVSDSGKSLIENGPDFSVLNFVSLIAEIRPHVSVAISRESDDVCHWTLRRVRMMIYPCSVHWFNESVKTPLVKTVSWVEWWRSPKISDSCDKSVAQNGKKLSMVKNWRQSPKSSRHKSKLSWYSLFYTGMEYVYSKRHHKWDFMFLIETIFFNLESIPTTKAW